MLAASRQAHNSPRTCARPAINGYHVAKLHTRHPRLPPPAAAAAHGGDHLASDRGLQPAGSEAEPKGPRSQPLSDPTDSTTSAAAAAAAAGSAAPGVASPPGSSSSPAVDSPSAATTVAAGNDTGISSSRAADSPSAPPTAEVPGNTPSAAPTEDPDDMDLQSILAALQGMGGGIFDAATELEPPKDPLLPSFDLRGVAAHLGGGKAAKVVVMCGAGISVSAGIPDFRTPGTGLYDQLERYNLPNPEAVFEINYFKRNPKPFHMLAKELFPGNYTPTPTHVFLRLLSDKGLLRRVYTQNIDSLEGQAGVPRDLIVAAHGNFDAARCIKCGAAHTTEYVKEAVMADKICHCSKGRCGGLVKPDIVFFGEQLPDRFYDLYEEDFGGADMLMVMGTSLVVNPFASLIDAVDQDVPRLLINRERVGEAGSYRGMFGKGFVFPPPSSYAPRAPPSDTPGAGDADAPAGTTSADSSSTAAAPGAASKATKGDNSSSKGGKGSTEGEGSSKTAGDNNNSSSSSGASSGGSAGPGGGAADAGKAAAATDAGPEPASAAASSTTDTGKPSSPSHASTPPAAADAPAATQSAAAAAAKQSQERDRGRCYRDALFLGDCDQGVSQLVDLLGWRGEFEQLLAEVRAAHPGGPHVAAEGHVLGDNIEEEQVPDTI